MPLYVPFHDPWADGEAGATPLTAAALNYIEAGIEAGSDHANLAGLGDDDHPQYVLHTELTAADYQTVTAANAAYVAKALVDGKGDLIGATADNAPSRVPGPTSDGQTLVADAALAHGMKWATVGGGDLVKLAEVTLTADGMIGFASIPATCRHLVVKLTGRISAGVSASLLALRLNGDTGANYDHQRLAGQGTSPSAGQTFADTRILVGGLPGNLAPAGLAGSVLIEIPHYRDTTFHKTLHGASAYKIGTASGNLTIDSCAGFWRNAAAVNAIVFVDGLATGTSAVLYGVK